MYVCNKFLMTSQSKQKQTQSIQPECQTQRSTGNYIGAAAPEGVAVKNRL